ncbi:G patch domain-containing protein 1 [Perkinsus chesapeaki]|uniref:G patch domain-containing protein 1 n=1 Tax=Perkinsus chesapeaki TaxID=330153 RepID=A0A7J6MMB0_PERCH|nr:G patch domain-containing protein 1 [Perkinsus chesapeaki]
MTDSSTSPSVRMPPGYGNPGRAGGFNNMGDPSEASRLLDGCHQIMVAMSSPAIFENSKEKAFQTFRRGCLDLKKDISATEGLESDKIDDWMIENCWLFLFELAKSRLRRKHILECMEILCTSDRWKKMLDDNDRIRDKLGELDDSFIQTVVSEFHVKPLPPKPQPQPKTKSNIRRGNRNNKWETGSAVATVSKPILPSTPVLTTSSLNRARSASLGSLNIDNNNDGAKVGNEAAAAAVGTITDGVVAGNGGDTQSSHGSWSIEEVDDDDDDALLNNNHHQGGHNTEQLQPATVGNTQLPKQNKQQASLNKKTSVIIIDKSRTRSGTCSSKHSMIPDDNDDDLSPAAAVSSGIASPSAVVANSIVDTNPFRNPKLFEDDNNITDEDDNISIDEWWNTPPPPSTTDPAAPQQPAAAPTTAGGAGAGAGGRCTVLKDNNTVEIEALQKQQEMILKQQQELMKAIQLLSMNEGGEITGPGRGLEGNYGYRMY